MTDALPADGIAKKSATLSWRTGFGAAESERPLGAPTSASASVDTAIAGSICPRISPDGSTVEWMFTYVMLPRMAPSLASG